MLPNLRPQPCQYLNGGSGAVQFFFCDERFFFLSSFAYLDADAKTSLPARSVPDWCFLPLAGLFCLSIAGRDVPHHPQFFQHRNPFRVQAAPSVLHPRLVDKLAQKLSLQNTCLGHQQIPVVPSVDLQQLDPLPKPFLVEVGTEPRFLQTGKPLRGELPLLQQATLPLEPLPQRHPVRGGMVDGNQAVAVLPAKGLHTAAHLLKVAFRRIGRRDADPGQ